MGLIIFSLFSPWYHFVLRDGPDSNNLVKSYETQYFFTGTKDSSPETINAHYRPWANVQRADSTAMLFSYCQVLDIIAILLVVLFIAGLFVAILKGKRTIAASLGLAAAIFSLFVPLFFMQELPVAMNADKNDQYSKVLPFWYSYDEHDYEIGAPGNVHHRLYTYSPDTGWYLPYISALLCFTAATLISIERPRPTWRKNVKPIVVATSIALILIAGSVALYPQPPQFQPTDSETMGLRAEKTDENWTLSITVGVRYLSGLHMQIIDPNTGAKTVDSLLSVGETADFMVNNNDRSGEGNWPRLNAGDSILLKSSGGHVQSGYKVLFIRNNNIAGSLNALP